MRYVAGVGALLVAVVLGVSPLVVGRAPMAQEPSLYERLGGRDGIALVVDDFVAILVKDDRVNGRLKDLKPADVARLKSNVADQVCDASGGPCAYLGRDMKTAHAGMNITGAEWDATVEDLVKALDSRQVSEKDRNELLGMLGPMKPDIVGQ